MTSQTSSITGWRRAVTTALAGGALAAGLVVGAAPALADPATPSTEADAPAAGELSPDMTADQALAIIATDYDTGAGGGQVSVLIHKIMTLRSQGYMASASNRAAIVDALEKRPNQAPLVEALEATLKFQMRNKMRAASQPQQPTTFGVTPGGVPGNNGAIMVPIAPGQ
ncbi:MULTISPECIES: hypothetical protein [unclassified Mycobacterium]|uniref:hypothetical protein n=1 Tax=unclassified Mycobacterium TaxID=2642494 RepID=UPI0029C77066|nr:MULTISPECIES: hypothetical protein [unclassified Mycobacterium]